MPTIRYAGVFEIDYEVVRADQLQVTAYFVVPKPLPKAGRQRLGSGRLSARKLSRSFRVNAMLGPRRLRSGFTASLTLTLDLAASSVRAQAKGEAMVGGRNLPGSPWQVDERWPFAWPRAPLLPLGKAQIAHVVVVMMENRSFDNLLGWLYADQGNQAPHNIPAQQPATFDGLEARRYWNPIDAADIGKPPEQVPEDRRAYATQRARSMIVPDPDPHEQFRYMSRQLFGTQQPTTGKLADMQGFVADFADAIRSSEQPKADPRLIMDCFSPAQLPVLSALARNYAVCDRWFASLPCQTWPNRAFVHAGTSCGRVNNLDKDVDDWTPPNPLYYNTPTIFNVLHELGVTWKVYADSIITPTLTRSQFVTQLGNPLLQGHFRGFTEFCNDAALGTLPSYSFVEPSFLEKKNDQHPPHDVALGDNFLHEVWQAVSSGPGWRNTLLVITYDEHGGCYDHVATPWGAVRPDASKPQKPFAFDRYGVRVPAVLVSPWIEPGTVFRAPTGGTEYDHTAILATLRDWQNLSSRAGKDWLKSRRVAAAPTLAPVLSRSTPRSDLPEIPRPRALLHTAPAPSKAPLNAIQSAVLAAALMGDDVTQEKYDKAVRQIARIRQQDAALVRLERVYQAGKKRRKKSRAAK
ncbi:alkaline phosphatase family protein [Candidatus Accumulibacter sp. ACC003]|uniref:alkaline phosphatase family protein n=1 Tax=Candidatus Accumulibacter sp. ACC003 TaxID=2823334 RepID=UPI0025C13CE4|nr:alkaline phosphatase family protein [Candidatus Accumulibacter sp. ACC003]